MNICIDINLGLQFRCENHLRAGADMTHVRFPLKPKTYRAPKQIRKQSIEREREIKIYIYIYIYFFFEVVD
jgi:hypothetical protein